MESTDMLSRRLSRNDSLDSTLNFESLRMSLQRPVGRKLVLRLSPIGTDTGSVSAKWRLKRTRKIEKNSVVPEFVCERDLDVKLIVSDVTCDVDSVADREYSCKRNNITVNQLKCGHRYLFKVEVVVPANGCIQHNYTGRNDNLNTSIDVGVPQLPPDGCVLAAGILATITSHNTLEFLRHVATIPIRPLCAVIGTGLGVGTDTGIHAGSTSFSNSPTTVGDCLASTGVSVTNTTTAGATVERQSSPEPINSGGLSNTGGTYKHHPKLIQEKAGHSLLASSTSSPNRNNTSLRHSSTTTGTSFENLTVPYFTGTSQNATPAIATCSSIVNRTVTAREAANGNNTTGSHTGMKTAGETTSVVDMAVVVGAGVGSGTGVVVNSSTDCTSLSPTTSRSACSSGTPSGVQSPSVSQNRSNYNNYLDNNSLLAVVLSTVPEDENSSPYSASPEGKPQIRKRTARKLRSLRSLEKAEKQSNTEDMLGLTVRATPITPDMSVDTTSTTRSTRTSLMDACVGNSDAEDGHDHKKTSTGTTRSATDTMPKEKRRSARERSTRTKSSRGTAPVVSQLDVTTRMIRANELQHRLLAVQGRRDNDVPVPYQHVNNSREPAGIGTSSMMSSWSNMGTLYDDSCGSTYINTVTGGMDTSSIVYPNLISGPQSPVQPPVRGIKHTGSSSKYRQQNSILPASKGGRSATTCTSAAATAVRGPVSEHGKILQEHEREQQPIEISSSVDTSSSKHVKTHDLTASSVSCDNPSVWDNACDKERTGGMDSPSSSISSKRQQRLQNLFRQSESGKVLSGAVVEPTAPPSTSGGDHHHNGVGIRGGGVHKFEVEVRIGDDSFKRFTYRTDSHLDRVAYDFLRRLRLKPVLHAGLVKAMRQQVSENKTLILLDVADLF
eukprot:Lankesteria_metandrocarpae@DN5461_c0_g1_i2.p1